MRGILRLLGAGLQCAFGTLSACGDPSAVDGLSGGVRLQLAPDSAFLHQSDVQRFTASLWDASGAELQGARIDWSSSGGAVDSTGAFRATAPGTYLVIARTPHGLADTAVALVRDETAPVPVTAECDAPRPDWIWCDDFERDRLASYFEYDSAGGRFTRSAGVGVGGSSAMRAIYVTTPQTSSGSLHLAFGRTPQPYFRPVDAGTADYREVFWRVWLRLPAGWQGGGADKLSRATSFVSQTSWAQAMIAHVWSGHDAPGNRYLYLDPASGTDSSGAVRTSTYNDFANLRWLGNQQGRRALFAPPNLGEWHCIEAHVRLNQPGRADGVFELWLDDLPDASRTALDWVGRFDAYGINAVFLENYWNSGAPVMQERYLDNLVVGTRRIGCGA